MFRITTWLASTIISVLITASLSANDTSHSDWVASLGGSCTYGESGVVIGIDLSNTWITDADLKKLTDFEDLQQIVLAYTKITDLGLEHLAPLRNVKVLNLHYAEYVTDLGIAHLKHWRNLEVLDARGTKITSSLFEHISQMTQLRRLDVSHSRVNDEYFEKLSSLERLEGLAFGGNKMSGDALPLLKLLPSLRELQVGGQQRTDSGLWSVAVTDFNIDNIADLVQLEVLDLSESRVTDRGVIELTKLTNLKTLNLRQTRVTSKSIAALSKLPDLRSLQLWRAAGIDDTAIPYFAALPNLTVLELSETNVTSAALSALAQMHNLRQLFLGGLDLTPEDVESLRQSLPNCHISWWPKPQIEYPSGARRR